MKKLFFAVLASISFMNAASCDQSLNSTVIGSVENQQDKEALSTALRDFRVTGVAFCVDPNFAFIYDNQNPDFVVTFKNSKNEIKTRRYQADITSWGLKFEFDIKLNLVMFVNTDINFEDSNKELQLGTGIDLGINLGGILVKQPRNLIIQDMYGNLRANAQIKQSPLHLTGLALTYAPFTNTKGGLLILSNRLGLQSHALSVVTSGNLKPLAAV